MLTIHRLSEDKRRDADFVSKTKEAPWDFKMNAGQGIEEGVIRERTDDRSIGSADGTAGEDEDETNVHPQSRG